MFDKYINYNRIAEEMIRNREDNLSALESLKEQYQEIMNDKGLKSIQCDKDRVQKSITNDAVINLVIQKETVKKRIDELNAERKLYDHAWKRLTEEEKRILEVFFKTGSKRQDALDILCEELEREPATVYRKKDEAVKRFKKLLFG
ncbi:MAG: hypothetical protein VB095_00515 [Anaerovorax sp.]|nr:hypothetical protein [Anaerovorax sp.]